MSVEFKHLFEPFKFRTFEVKNGFVGATGAIAFEANGNRRDARVTIWRVVDGEMALLS